MTGLFTNTYVHIILSSTIVYIFITLALRLFGKKELTQLSVLDIVFILLISNAVQNAMVGSDTSLQGGLLAAITLFTINYIFKYILFRSKNLSKLMEGQPEILISEGKINDKNLHKLQISTDELLEAIREHGVSDISEVNLAILEIDGNISILSHDFKKRSVRGRFKRRKTNNSHQNN